MNDDGRLVGALVQGNEVVLHHAPRLPAYRWNIETLAWAAVLSQDHVRRHFVEWQWAIQGRTLDLFRIRGA